MKLKVFFTISLLFCITGFMQAQVTIWEEDFSGYSNGTITGADNNSPSGADWTTSCPTCNRTNEFRVDANQFHVENTGEIATWTSENIDISGYSNVSISVEIDMDDNQFEASDCISLYYNTGSGNVLFSTNGNLCDDGADPTFATQTGLSGSTLTITIEAITNNTNEDLYFDNIVVTGSLPLGNEGPGGVGSVDGSGSLVLWLNAQTIDQANATNVSSWSDLSGYNNNAVAVSGREPVFVTAQRNGFAGVQFVEANTDYLRIPDDASLKPNTISAFVVGTFTNNSDNYAPFIIKTNNYNEWSAGYGIARDNGTDDLIAFVTEWDVNFVLEDFAYGNTDIMTLIYDKNTVAFYENEALAGTDNYSSDIQNTTNYLYLGISPNGSSGIGTGVQNSLDGYIYEVIIYGQALNTFQRILVHNYLSSKYNINISANDLFDGDTFANGDYDYEITGIGQASDGSNHTDAQGSGIVRIHNPSNLGNNESLFIGHDNGALNSKDISDLPDGIESRIARDWYVTETGEVGTVTITIDLSEVAGSITASDLRLLIDNNGTYATGATAIGGATDLGGGLYQWTGVDLENTNHFTIGSVNFSQTPLPVQLIDFKATANYESKSIDINWTTANELNNDFFTIEKSKNLIDYEEIAVINGKGTTNNVSFYKEQDFTPFFGESYYRLTQTDFDGKTNYFTPQKVIYSLSEKEAIEINLFPNPTFNKSIFIEIPKQNNNEISLTLIDLSGHSINLNSTLFINESNALISSSIPEYTASGVYFIQISIGQNTYTKKLIVK